MFWLKRFSLILLGSLVLAGCETTGTISATSSSSNVVHIQKITYKSVKAGTLIKVYGSKSFPYTSYKLSDPLRLAVEIPNVVLDFKPQKIRIEEMNVVSISVVNFPKVNSVRLEMEILVDSPFRINKESGYLSILIAEKSGSPLPSPRPTKAKSYGSFKNSDDIEKEKSVSVLTRENRALKRTVADLETQNRMLTEQSVEDQKMIEETQSMAEAQQARILFMEQQLNKIQTRLAGKKTSGKKTKRSVGISSKRSSGSLSINKAGNRSERKTKISSKTAPVLVSGGKTGGNSIDNGAIKEMLTEWVIAWNNEDIDNFSKHYGAEFKTGKQSRAGYLDSKRRKFANNRKPSVKIKNLKISSKGNVAKAVFVQKYRSKTFSSTGIKTLSLVRTPKGWQIISETWSAQ